MIYHSKARLSQCLNQLESEGMANKKIGIILSIILVVGTTIYVCHVSINLPGVNQGYAPKQPIAFSHRLHSGDLQIQCLYCHTGADKSRHAGIPSATTCMNCHKFVTASWDKVEMEAQKAQEENREILRPVSDELKKLYAAVGFDIERMKYHENRGGKPIEWIRVHNLPDFVYFDHRRHVNADVTCQQCHGSVETMKKVSQVNDLTMGWCVNCHRDVNNGQFPDLQDKFASTNCAGCHY